MAAALLEAFDAWDTTSLTTLRSYARSCARLEILQAANDTGSLELFREVRCNLGLLRALKLEKEKP